MFDLFRRLMLAIQKTFNNFDPSVKTRFSDEESLSKNPPIFIIGSPRAGSTLLFQVLSGQFQLSYISNIMAAFPSLMVRLLQFFPSAARGYTGEIKESRYGYIPGIFSPNESGKILAKWLEDSQDPNHDIYVRRTFAAITNLSGCPMVFKNQNRLTVNIDRLESIFDNARYISIERNPLYNAQSLLIARREVLADDQAWFSAKPPGYEKHLDKDPYFQVLWQVLSLQKIVEKVRLRIPEERFITLDYEEFCANPGLILKQMGQKYNLCWRAGSNPDAIKLTASKKIKLTDEEWIRLTETYQEIKKSALFEE